jgi:hypothetical protein
VRKFRDEREEKTIDYPIYNFSQIKTWVYKLQFGGRK